MLERQYKKGRFLVFHLHTTLPNMIIWYERKLLCNSPAPIISSVYFPLAKDSEYWPSAQLSTDGLNCCLSWSRLDVTKLPFLPALSHPSLLISQPFRPFTFSPARSVCLWLECSGTTYKPGGTRVVGPGVVTWSDMYQSIAAPENRYQQLIGLFLLLPYLS